MDELRALQTLGITLPSPAYIVGALFFGLIGLAAFRSGRRAERPTRKWLGVALMFYPYAVPQTWLMWLRGVAMCVWLYADARRA